MASRFQTHDETHKDEPSNHPMLQFTITQNSNLRLLEVLAE